MSVSPGPPLPTFRLESAGRIGVACQIAPGVLVSLASLVDGRPGGSHPSAILTPLGEGGGGRVEATPVVVDPTNDVAVLEAEGAWMDELPELAGLILEGNPAEGSRWQAWLAGEGRLMEFGGSVGPLGRMVPAAELTLRIEEGPPPHLVPPGTPVFANGLLFGLVVGLGGSGLICVAPGAIVAALESAVQEREERESNVGSGAMSMNRPATKGGPRRKATKRAEGPPGPVPTVPADLFARLSASSHRALEHADGMRRRMGRAEVHMEQLILALYQKDDGPTRKEITRAGISEAMLRERLGDIAEVDLPAWGDYEVAPLTAIPPHSEHVAAALAAADAIAKEVGSKEVQSRHLFHGVLSVSDCDAMKWMIEEYGVDAAQIDMSAEPSKGAAKRARAQVSADLAEGEDLLDVREEAEAICAIVAAHETSPPLSIGLFGDWGTGKTFFMGLMEKRIEKLKETARQNADSAYCSNIVQLRFNAWHYIDTDLWASLTAEIFDGLATALRQDSAIAGGADPEGERARLLAATTHLRDVRSETERRKADADAALRESEERLTTLARDERDIASRLSPRAILKATYRYVAGDETTAAALAEGAAKLGIPKAKALASDTRAQLLEAKGAWGDLKAIWIALRSGSSRLWLLLLSITLLALLLAALSWDDAGAVSRWAVAAATLLGTALTFLAGAMPLVRGGLRTIRAAREASDAAIQEERARRQKALEEAHAAVQKRLVSEEAKIDRINAELAELERQLELLRADRQMADFIWEKQASTDYTRHFGVIARARHDFTRLSKLLESVVAQPADAEKTGSPIPRIDRIVLYIDDLDRCPEEKVVDVLQAVHLLLAFPLFIVVVGVDSRWLLHSLRQHASVFRQREDDGLAIDDEEQVQWESTPFNYLEKIFQIPFNLRPMEGKGFANLIDNLTIPKAKEKRAEGRRAEEKKPGEPVAAPGGGDPAPPPPQPPAPDGGVHPAPAPEVTPDVTPAPAAAQQAQGAPPAHPAQAEEHEEEVDPNPPYLSVSAEERAFMHQMHRLIATPRAAKRYVNVYRLFRASLSEGLRELLEEEGAARSRRVLLMLAIVTGFPQEGAVILRELVERNPQGGWWEFVHRLAGEYTHGAEPAEFLGSVPRGAASANGNAPTDHERQRAVRWEELLRRLKAVREEVMRDEGDPPCPEFTQWAKFVARYSFESGRVLTARQETTA